MPGDFLDTNILVYAASADAAKAARAIALIESRPTISVQVLSEFVSVARRKMKLDWPAINAFLAGIRRFCRIRSLDVQTQRDAVGLAERYGYTIYDATIIASALSAGCAYLMTEDLHDGPVVDDRLRIINPFA